MDEEGVTNGLMDEEWNHQWLNGIKKVNSQSRNIQLNFVPFFFRLLLRFGGNTFSNQLEIHQLGFCRKDQLVNLRDFE